MRATEEKIQVTMHSSEASGRKWSAEEDLRLLKLRAQNRTWTQISKKFRQRSALSCRLHYRNYLTKEVEWNEDKLIELATCYEKYKPEMWAKISRELRIPWQAAEKMHWKLGSGGLASRDSTSRTITPKPSLPNVTSHRPYLVQPSGQIQEQIRLPSFKELVAGIQHHRNRIP
uniref:Transcription factor MYB44 n=1 Tax=Talaromyces marneffei PM1 TaxID=1077442 RepID=A0A093V764_TALMA